MTDSEKRAGCLAVGSAIVAGLLVFIILGMRQKANTKTHWPHTTATITRRWTHEWQDKNTNRDDDWNIEYYAKFAYAVNGQPYETPQRVTSALGGRADDKVIIRYNPQYPGWAE